MVLVIVLSDYMGIVQIAYVRNNQFLKALEYHDYGNDQTCSLKDTNFSPNVGKLIHMNKYRAAFRHVEQVIRESGERIGLDFNFQTYNGPLGFFQPLTNIDGIIFRGNSTPQLINDWHNEVSQYPVKDLFIVINRGETMRGLGQLEAVKNAKRLEIAGEGICDITDQEVMNFNCDYFNINSPNLSPAGVTSYNELCHQRYQEQAVAAAAAAVDNEIVISMIMPRDAQAPGAPQAPQALQSPQEQNMDLAQDFERLEI